MTIREFNSNDINNGLLDVLKETWFITEISDETLTEWQMSNNYMFVAEINNTVIGTLTLHTQKKLIRNGGLCGFIEDVAVKSEYRGNNIGSLLVQEGIKKAKELGCYKVILSCFDERINFYIKNGFFRESNTMRFNF
jgi:predicted N-acetyltransferase YhbS